MRAFDDELTVRLLRDRYRALARLREEKGGGDRFVVRMLGRPALVTRGVEGVRDLYDPGLVARKGAMPAPVRLVLFGPGAVHGLDDEQHTGRKQLFLDVITPTSVAGLAEKVGAHLDAAVDQWLRRGAVSLYDELVTVYGSAVLDWAGTGTAGAEGAAVSRDLATMVDGFGVGGSLYARAALARVRAHRWAVRVVRAARSGDLQPSPDTALAVLAATPRRELPDLVAATELLNVVRPTVAVAYFGAYAAQALDRRPDMRASLAAGSLKHLRAFEHEIRRYYPFVPLLPGRLRRDLDDDGRRLHRRDWMILDVLGTNRDAELWPNPDEFGPERFLDREPTAFDYVPHGGGHVTTGHRCPGEPAAVSILEVTLRRLAALRFELTAEGREVPLDRIPSLPADRVQLRGVRRSTVPA